MKKQDCYLKHSEKLYEVLFQDGEPCSNYHKLNKSLEFCYEIDNPEGGVTMYYDDEVYHLKQDMHDLLEMTTDIIYFQFDNDTENFTLYLSKNDYSTMLLLI